MNDRHGFSAKSGRRSFRRTDWWHAIEGPTWLLIVTVYGAWFLLIREAAVLPGWVLYPAGAVLIAWHNNIQHEILHGHPTRWPAVNALLGWPPLGLWMPYAIYKERHKLHHTIPTLAAPGEDPESYYVEPATWARLPAPARWVLLVNHTLAGRMLIGPALVAGGFWIGEIRRLLARDLRDLGTWTLHICLAAVLLFWIDEVCGLPVWLYVLGIAYPGLSVGLVRSYLEHRPAKNPGHRTAIVEGGRLSGLLFLNNNLHLVHHDHPDLPWYEIPAAYRAERGTVALRNGGYVFRGYGEVAWRFLVRPKDHPVYPLRHYGTDLWADRPPLLPRPAAIPAMRPKARPERPMPPDQAPARPGPATRRPAGGSRFRE